PVDDQMASDGKKPGIEFGASVILLTAFHHPDPSLLEDVFSEFAIAGEEDEITQQPVLIAFDEAVEQIRVSSAETAGDLNVLSCSKVTVIRVPVQPIGCPSAIDPPLTLSFSRSKWSSRSQARTCAAKASLSSMRSAEEAFTPYFSSSFFKAGTGPMPMRFGSTP